MLWLNSEDSMVYLSAFNNLETLIVTFILISFSVFMFLVFYELNFTDSAEHAGPSENIYGFLILWIIECTIISLYYIHCHPMYTYPAIRYIDIFSAVFILASAAAFIDFIRNQHLSFIPLAPICIIVSLLMFIEIYFRIPIQAMYLAVLSFHTLFSVFITLSMARNRKTYAYISCLYTLCSACIILAINTNKILWKNNYILVTSLALSILLTLSYFLLFSRMYTDKLKEKIKLKSDAVKISGISFIDRITHLKNVQQLEEDIKSKYPENTYLIMINFENYNNFINLAGHAAGNEALRNIAHSLQSIVAAQDEVYRYYYDKFIMLHSGDSDSCSRLIKNIFDLFPINNYKAVILKPYLGITHLGSCAKSFDSIIKELEISSEYAQRNSNYYVFYNEDLYLELQEKLELEVKIREAVEQNNWEIYFQPKVSLKEKKVIGAEALIRWKNNENRIAPDVFIPLSEQIGLIGEIGKFVIRTTFKYINSLYQLNFNDLKISINISPYQLMDKDFFNYVTEALQIYSINPCNIIFEITETALINNISNVNSTIIKLKELGIHFSLDDFGTGYSCLYHLSNLNLDEIKFDRTFTSSLPDNEKNIIILQSITSMAKQLCANIVIEGIEKKEQMDCVTSIGCDYYQGYYFSKPVPFKDFVLLMNQVQC